MCIYMCGCAFTHFFYFCLSFNLYGRLSGSYATPHSNGHRRATGRNGSCGYYGHGLKQSPIQMATVFQTTTSSNGHLFKQCLCRFKETAAASNGDPGSFTRSPVQAVIQLQPRVLNSHRIKRPPYQVDQRKTVLENP